MTVCQYELTNSNIDFHVVAIVKLDEGQVVDML